MAACAWHTSAGHSGAYRLAAYRATPARA